MTQGHFFSEINRFEFVSDRGPFLIVIRSEICLLAFAPPLLRPSSYAKSTTFTSIFLNSET